MKGSEIPAHVAIIMDGNGRWGVAKGLHRADGYREGVRVIEPIVRACRDAGVKALTMFAFSTENWKRPKSEVETLMELLREFFSSNVLALARMGVRIRGLGDRATIPAVQRVLVDRAEAMTARNDGFSLNFAFNYGSRMEIANAARALAIKAAAGQIDPAGITEEDFERELYTAELPPVDLLIRTGGEMRLSNFLLYQIAYAELAFLPEYWPDFTPAILERELQNYARRERRFGGLGAQEQT